MSPNIVFDIDGTLTDGKYYVDEDGKIRKTFHCNDIVAIRLFKEAGWRCIAITSATKEGSAGINKKWAEEKLEVEFYRAKPFKKLERLQSLGLDLQDTYYVGDCIDDLFVAVKVYMSFCPANAIKFVRKNVTHVLERRSGEGVLLEILGILQDFKIEIKK